MDKTRLLVTARLRRRVPILMCRKCLKRAPDGSDFKRALKVALKQRDHQSGKPRLVTTSCFGLCPKRAIVVASGATLSRGELLLVIGDATVAAEAAAVLLPDRDPASAASG